MGLKSNNLFFKVFVLCILAAAQWSMAQEDSGENEAVYGKDINWEMGFHVGNVLPNKIDNVTEITSLAGLRGGWRTSDSGFVEGGYMTGSEENATFSNLHVTWRVEQPIEMFVANFLFGFDYTDTISAAGVKDTQAGIHLGGGVMSLIAEELWFRADMKYNFNPGTSLYFGFGFMMRYGSDGGAGGGQN